PSMWSVEAAYGFDLKGKGTTVAASYQQTDEALALGLPESRYQAGITVGIMDNLDVSLEWRHDQDYDVGDTGGGATAATAGPGTGEGLNVATLQLAASF
ncbi:MAG: hypothetical protein HQL53_14570, partial [Magnetococcales bacterium]|nr:hypothetical protein [Magnetococcales bacterium]